MATVIKLEITDQGNELKGDFSLSVDGNVTATGTIAIQNVEATLKAVTDLKAKLPSEPKD